MAEIKISRLRFALMLGAAVVGGGAIAGTAVAYQGHMDQAVSDLNAAYYQLSVAVGNKGGHRENAMNLIQQAIAEVNAGIAFAGGDNSPGPPAAPPGQHWVPGFYGPEGGWHPGYWAPN